MITRSRKGIGAHTRARSTCGTARKTATAPQPRMTTLPSRVSSIEAELTTLKIATFSFGRSNHNSAQGALALQRREDDGGPALRSSRVKWRGMGHSEFRNRGRVAGQGVMSSRGANWDVVLNNPKCSRRHHLQKRSTNAPCVPLPKAPFARRTQRVMRCNAHRTRLSVLS